MTTEETRQLLERYKIAVDELAYRKRQSAAAVKTSRVFVWTESEIKRFEEFTEFTRQDTLDKISLLPDEAERRLLTERYINLHTARESADIVGYSVSRAKAIFSAAIKKLSRLIT